MPAIDYGTEVTTLDGRTTDLQAYRGKVLLIVNTASKCGFTPQYAGLQALWERLGDQGLVVLGFPCNQFGAQEPGSEAEIKSFCTSNYGVRFPMFAKLEVNGEGSHPLYRWLREQDTQPDGSGDIKWNFAKFLVGKDGRVLARFSPMTDPESPELLAALESALG
jgi:glutathione peroxidase